MNRKHSEAAALVIGFTIQGLAIARALAREGVTVYALERVSGGSRILRHPVRYTNHARILSVSSLMGEAIIEALLDVRRSIDAEEVVLYAANDLTVLTLAKHWPSLQDQYRLSWATSRDEVVRVVRKGNLPQFCALAGVDYPRTMTLHSGNDIERCADELSFPVLLKPDCQALSFKTHRCDSLDELNRFVGGNDAWPLVAQEWIDGDERNLYFHACFAVAGREHFGYTGRKVRASPPTVGIATVIETEEAPQVREAALRLLPVLKLTGPVAMEFKRGPDGKYRFIEANVGRTEYCVDLGIRAGFNLPYVEYCYATGLPLPAVGDWIESMWFDTDKEPFCYLYLCAKEWRMRPHGKQPVFPYHGQERWQVRLAAVVEIVRKLWGRGWRRVARIATVGRNGSRAAQHPPLP